MAKYEEERAFEEWKERWSSLLGASTKFPVAFDEEEKKVLYVEQSRRAAYIQLHDDLTRKMREITIAKNNDYTGNTDNPFSNFTMVEENNVCSTEKGFLVRMSDKMSRINSLLSVEAQVKDEAIEDTLLDLANYCLLMIGYLKDKSESK